MLKKFSKPTAKTADRRDSSVFNINFEHNPHKIYETHFLMITLSNQDAKWENERTKFLKSIQSN